MENQTYECEVCDYWEIMHKVKEHNYREGQFNKCAHCTKPQRLEAYKGFWNERSKV